MTATEKTKLEASAPPGNGLYLIDASIYIFRAYFSMPDHWQAKNGYSTQAVYGFAMFLLQLIERADMRYCALAFDESLDSCFRNKIYPAYKSSRALPDDALAFQLQACRKLAENMGFACFASKTYEADDLLASLRRQFSRKNRPAVIVSRDKDLGQLLKRPEDRFWDFADDRLYSNQCFTKKFGVRPEQLPCYLALVGDNIDDIPGVPGLGPKTAVQLLHAFESLENIFLNLDSVGDLPIRGAKKLAEKLSDYEEQCHMAKELATLKEDIPLKHRRRPLRLLHLDFSRSRRQVSQRQLFSYLQTLGFGERTQTRFNRVYKWV